MSAPVDNGGPAFPHSLPDLYQPDTAGMSLRDYFAAQALPWFAEDASADPVNGLTWQQIAARGSYDLADAMIEARAR